MSAVKRSMGRRKIEIKMIENLDVRQVCFSKRRAGLFKKASELCIMSGAEVAIVVFSPGGKAFSFGHPSVDSVINRFMDDINGGSNSAALIKLSEVARRDPVVAELSRQYTQLVGMVKEQKRRNEEFEAATNAEVVGSHHLWRRDLDELNLAELQQYYEALQELKKLVSNKTQLLNLNVPYVNVLDGTGTSGGLHQQMEVPELQMGMGIHQQMEVPELQMGMGIHQQMEVPKLQMGMGLNQQMEVPQLQMGMGLPQPMEVPQPQPQPQLQMGMGLHQPMEVPQQQMGMPQPIAYNPQFCYYGGYGPV